MPELRLVYGGWRRALNPARDVSDKDETMIGSSDVTLGSTKRKKLRCVECGTKFRPSSVKVHSWKTPIGVFLIILLVGLSVRAFYQFSAMQDGIDSEPDTQSASSSSDKPVVEPCLGAVQNTPYADDQSATQELEDVLEQAPSDVEAGISETNNSNTSDSSPRATGLYDQKQEIVEPSQAELERLDLELAERTASSQEQVQRVEQSLSNADQEERIGIVARNGGAVLRDMARSVGKRRLGNLFKLVCARLYTEQRHFQCNLAEPT